MRKRAISAPYNAAPVLILFGVLGHKVAILAILAILAKRTFNLLIGSGNKITRHTLEHIAEESILAINFGKAHLEETHSSCNIQRDSDAPTRSFCHLWPPAFEHQHALRGGPCRVNTLQGVQHAFPGHSPQPGH